LKKPSEHVFGIFPRELPLDVVHDARELVAELIVNPKVSRKKRKRLAETAVLLDLCESQYLRRRGMLH